MNPSETIATQKKAIIILAVALTLAVFAAAYFYLQTRHMKTAEPVEVSINSESSVLPKHEVSLIQATEVVANLAEVKEIRARVEKDPKQDLHLVLRNAKEFTVNVDDKKYWVVEVGVSHGDEFELKDTYYVGVHDAEILLYDIGSDKIIKLKEQRKVND